MKQRFRVKLFTKSKTGGQGFMGSLSGKAARLVKATGIPLWGFRFHAIGLTGNCRFGGGKLRVLYAGTRPFFHYFKETTFDGPPAEEPLGTFDIHQLGRVRALADWDLEVYRGSRAFAGLGLFPSAYFVPEWVAGSADLLAQERCDETSKSRKRDRSLLRRNDISYRVTSRSSDLDHFYNEMYLPQVQQNHGESVFLMSHDEMTSRVQSQNGRLVMIYRGNEAVGGSLIVQEAGRPRLYSQGVLQNDKELLRSGVGTAVYICSFDYLLESGFTEVHMGWSRALLSDGVLYFKQRFGLQVDSASGVGHFFRHRSDSGAAREFLCQTGFIHGRRGRNKVVLFSQGNTEKCRKDLDIKRAQCRSMGLNSIDVVDLAPGKGRSGTSMADFRPHRTPPGRE